MNKQMTYGVGPYGSVKLFKMDSLLYSGDFKGKWKKFFYFCSFNSLDIAGLSLVARFQLLWLAALVV